MAESFLQTYLKNLKQGFSGGANLAKGIAKEVTRPVVQGAADTAAGFATGVTGKDVKFRVPLYDYEASPVLSQSAVDRGDATALASRSKKALGQAAEVGLTAATMGGGKLLTAGTKLAPASRPIVQKGVQAGVDFGVGVMGSAAADIAAGKDVDISKAVKSGAVSSLLPIAAEGGVKSVQKVAGISSKKLSNLLTKKEQQYSDELSKVTKPDPIKVAGTELEIPDRFQMSRGDSFKKKVVQTKLDLVRGLQDLRTNFVDDRAPITHYFSSELKKNGALDEDVNQVIQATRDARAADSRGMAKVLDWQERFNELNKGKNIPERTALLNEYADIRTKLDTTREYAGADVDRAALQGRLNEIETKLPPQELADLQQAHKELVLDFNSKQLDEDVASGLRSPEEAARLREANPNYSRLIVKDYLDEAVKRGSARRDAKGIKFFGRKEEALIDPDTLPATEANIISAFTRERQRSRNTETLAILDADARTGTNKFQQAWSTSDKERLDEILQTLNLRSEAKQAILEKAGENADEAARLLQQERALLEAKKMKGIAEDVDLATGRQVEVKQRVNAEKMADKDLLETAKQQMRDRKAVAQQRREFDDFLRSRKADIKKKKEIGSEEALANIEALRSLRGRGAISEKEFEAARLQIQNLSSNLATSQERKRLATEMVRILDGLDTQVQQRYKSMLGNLAGEKRSALLSSREQARGLRQEAQSLSAENKDLFLEAQQLFAKRKQAMEQLSQNQGVRVFRNGKEEIYSTADRRLADYFANEVKKDDGIVGQMIRYGADATRLFATGINPAFSIANLARDYQNAKLNLPSNVNLTLGDMAASASDAFAYKFPTVFGKGQKTPEAIKEAYRLGGPLATLAREVKDNPSVITKEIINKRPNWDLISQLKDFSEASEITTRLAVLKAAKRSGVTDKNALRNMMRDATVDFEVGGKTIRELNRMIPFLNARIQGARNLIKAFGSDPAGVARKLNYYSILPTVVLESWNKRFPSYAAVPEAEKNNSYSIVIGEGRDANDMPFAKRITIPKGQGQALASAWARVLDDDSIPKDMKGQFLAASLLDLAPLDQVPILGGSIAQAIQSWVTNTNYKGEFVVPPGLKDQPSRNQFTATTSPTAIALSRTLGKITGGTETRQGVVEPSPIQLENFFRTMTSGFGSSLLSGVDYATKVAEEKTLFPSYMKDASGAALASKLPVLQSFVRVSNRAVPAAVAKQNKEFEDTRALMSSNKKQAAQKFLDDVKKQSTPEGKKAVVQEYERKGLLKDGTLIKEAENLAEKKAYVYGIDPNASAVVRAEQINNYVKQFSETSQQLSVLKDIQKANLLTEDTRKALIARKLIDKLSELQTPDERRDYLEKMKGSLDEKVLGYMAEIKKIELAQ